MEWTEWLLSRELRQFVFDHGLFIPLLFIARVIVVTTLEMDDAGESGALSVDPFDGHCRCVAGWVPPVTCCLVCELTDSHSADVT
jgi:hypothetical protein